MPNIKIRMFTLLFKKSAKEITQQFQFPKQTAVEGERNTPTPLSFCKIFCF